MARSIRRIRKRNISKNNHSKSQGDKKLSKAKKTIAASLDHEERKVLDSFERGEWRSVPALREKSAEYQTFASAALEARGLVSVQLQKEDLKAIRRKAADAGVPHQTLISTIVHDFVAGQLVKPHS